MTFRPTGAPGSGLFIGGVPRQAEPVHDTAIMNEAAIYAAIDELIEMNQGDAELLPYLRAWRAVGFLLSEENMHMFSEEDIDAFSSAVERYEREGNAIDRTT